MNLVKLLMIVCGIILLVAGAREQDRKSNASQTPQEITCAELAANGPGKNAHVRLKDFRLCGEWFVYQTEQRGVVNEWKQVWIPVVPPKIKLVDSLADFMKGLRGEPAPKPKDFHVVLRSKFVKDEPQFHALNLRGEITGLVASDFESLPAREKELLQNNYPGVDFTTCYFLDHDRKPYGEARSLVLIGGGALMTLIGGGWILFDLCARRRAKVASEEVLWHDPQLDRF
jgi:hypothetical protein